MRVITTFLYFDYEQIQGYEGYRRLREAGDKNPGVSFAWFAGDTTSLPDISNYRTFRARPREPGPHPDRDQIRGILDLFVRDADERAFYRIPREDAVKNGDIVDFILKQGIVIERSPPILISLKGFLTNSNSPLWIGTFIGSAGAWDHPTLLLITVPGGILAVSSAQGIATALQAGLNKAIKRLFDKT